VKFTARGGLAWKNFHDSKSLEAKDNQAFTWQAKVDHFDTSNNDTYAQRYYIDKQYWNGDGPVFLSIGGEGTLTGPPGGYMAVLAANYSALLVSLEHRFYGESIPNGNVLSENLVYLTVEQALADLATFTDYFTNEYKTGDNSWFAFGGSYPGALASWYRINYPEKSVGSLSSSGVVNCIIDFPEFDMQVSAAIGNRCSDQIKRINAAFERTIAKGADGWNYATDLFLCEKDMWTQDFFYMIADSW
jgi:pimeloyl-ACP methyl ester carboxylesterase